MTAHGRLRDCLGNCSDQGMATAELAVALPSLVLLVLFGAGVLRAVGGDLRCQDAARLAARAAARGEPSGEVRRIALGAAPPGADVAVSSVAGMVRVVVTSAAGIPGPWNVSGPHVTLRGDASGALEPVQRVGGLDP